MIRELMPSSTPYYMFDAWASCMHWAIGNEDVLQAFRDETGNRWTSGRSGIDRMIDDACGMPEAFIREFIAWANENIWGDV